MTNDVPTTQLVPEGATARALRPGDFILCHGDYLFSKLIRFGQKIRYPSAAASWNHAALVISEDGDLAEALGQGVIRTHVSNYKQDEYIVVRVEMSDADRAQVLAYAHSVLTARYKYSKSTIVGLFFTLALNSPFAIGSVGSAICSGFVSEALTRAGYIWPVTPSVMKPADLAAYFDVPAWQINATTEG